MTKQTIRTAIFSNSKRKSIIVDAFDTQIEVKQPTLGELLGMQDLKGTKEQIVQSLMDYCFVPGTDEKVFDAADADVILGIPFGDGITALQNAIGDLTGIEVEEEKGNS